MFISPFVPVFFAVTSCLGARVKEGCKTSDYIYRNTEDDTLQNIIINEYPEHLSTFLVSCRAWDKELAWAYSLGVAMGRHRGMLSTMNISAIISILGIDPEPLATNFSNLCYSDKWRENSPIPHLFDHQQLNKDLSSRICSINLDYVRILFSKYSFISEAAIALDVAILKWIAGEIRVKHVRRLVNIPWFLLQPICALTMIPSIGEQCAKDILLVLTELLDLIDSDKLSSKKLLVHFRIMLTLIKMLDDGPIRKKVVEIASFVYHMEKAACAESRLILGAEHAFVKSMEENVTKEDLHLRLQHQLDHKLCSIGDSKDLKLDAGYPFISVRNRHYLSALITSEESLQWDQDEPVHPVQITIWNKPGVNPKQTHILVFSEFPPPATFWKQIRSCTSLAMFHAILENLMIRQMILSYGITIVETSLRYELG